MGRQAQAQDRRAEVGFGYSFVEHMNVATIMILATAFVITGLTRQQARTEEQA